MVPPAPRKATHLKDPVRLLQVHLKTGLGPTPSSVTVPVVLVVLFPRLREPEVNREEVDRFGSVLLHPDARSTPGLLEVEVIFLVDPVLHHGRLGEARHAGLLLLAERGLDFAIGALFVEALELLLQSSISES